MKNVAALVVVYSPPFMPRYICLHESGFRVQREACPSSWTQSQLSGKIINYIFLYFLKRGKGGTGITSIVLLKG